ncbi:hypothetical protein FKN04_12815 [Bacillus glycinifermentans]|uniref:hypothetical protein n=1 Tax=Bacillus glycinifermentans TaxID=1664069 RepID=UPI001583E78C|nr:hypothetical protein [Bacillus glycinifermentans]NUJ17457.1 hypothetical protein [Bacillus glycinifermentans]
MSYFIVYYTHHGSDWKSDYREIFKSEKEARDFKIEHKEEMKDVEGIECIDFLIKEKTEKQLRGELTVNEYCELFPEFKKMLDELDKK